MRHRKKTVRLQRRDGHRRSLISNLAGSVIEHGRIRTTKAKAKAIRPVVEKLITLAKQDTVHSRRQAFKTLRNKESVKRLFEITPKVGDRPGGYCRITKLGARMTDSAEMAVIEFVDYANLGAEEPAAAE